MNIRDVFSGRNYSLNTYYKPVFEDIRGKIDELKGFSPEQLDVIESIVYCSQDFILDTLRTNPLFENAHKKLKSIDYFCLHAILFSYYWLCEEDSFKDIFIQSVENIKNEAFDKLVNNEILARDRARILKNILNENPEKFFSQAELVMDHLTGCDVLKEIQLNLFKQNDAKNTEEIIGKYRNLASKDFQYTLYFSFAEMCGCKPLGPKDTNVIMFWVRFHSKSQEFLKTLCRNAFNKLYAYLIKIT